jgi:hypothetical protein
VFDPGPAACRHFAGPLTSPPIAVIFCYDQIVVIFCYDEYAGWVVTATPSAPKNHAAAMPEKP